MTEADPAPAAGADDRGLDPLEGLDAEAARQGLAACCGSRRWVDAMIGRLPFGSAAAVLRASSECARELESADWLEAFSHHPQIGDVDALRVRFAQPRSLEWSRGEQAGVAAADERLLERLAAGNQAYLDRFGYIFIIRAAGRNLAEMVDALEARLHNDPAAELAIAAGQQLEITQLRLEKWLRSRSKSTNHEVP